MPCQSRSTTRVGPDRLLFGTDSSFFPRGWVSDVYEQQSSALDELGASTEVREKIFGGNFDRVFPARDTGSVGGNTSTRETAH